MATPNASQAVLSTSRSPLAKVKQLLWAILGPSNKSMLPFIPRPVKLLVAFLFILNWRSWPFVWHWKVWKHVFEVRWDAWRRARGGIAERKRWLFDRSCVNADPFEIVSTLQCYAGMDDCDYNMHLSNSCYAKSVDSARMKAAMDVFLPIFGDGAWLPLGGAQYQFVREIPLGTHYEIQTSIGGWEEKWMFLVHHYVSYPSKNKKAQSASQAIGPMPGPNITAPSTPSLIDSPPQSNSPKPMREPYRAPPGFNLSKLRKQLPEGAVIHCVAVSLYCFKIGRITIPPRVAFIASGFGDPSKQRWFRVQDLRFSAPDPMLAGKGKTGKDLVTNRMSDMLKGGWKTDDYIPAWAKPKVVAEANTAAVDASWTNISASTSTNPPAAPVVGGYLVGETSTPAAPSPVDIASPMTPAEGAASTTPNMASALPAPSNSSYLLSTGPPATAVGTETLPAPPLTPVVQPGNSFWDLPEFEERRREAMRDVFAGMMKGMKGLREKGL